EVRRALRPGGRLCVAVPTGYTERVFDLLHPRYISNAGHVHRFKRQELARKLNEAGLPVTAIRTQNLAPALAWTAHALVRTEADATGRVLSRRWIDVVAAAVVKVGRMTPGLRRVVA